MVKKEITNEDLLKTINNSFTELEGKMATKDNLTELEGKINKQFSQIKSTMVTKDYLDEKLSDLRGDLVVLMRKEDKKLRTLVEILKERRVITKKDEERILAMEPFPDLELNLKTA